MGGICSLRELTRAVCNKTETATTMPPSMQKSEHRESTRAFNGAPSLDGALAMQGWRKAIKIENAAADRLDRALEMKRTKSREALALTGRHVSMPMPPTTMTLMMSRLNRPETRELAMRRSLTRTNSMASELPWAQQLAGTPYAILAKTPSRGAMRPHALESTTKLRAQSAGPLRGTARMPRDMFDILGPDAEH